MIRHDRFFQSHVSEPLQAQTMHQQQQLTHELFRRFSTSDIPGVLDMLTDDVTWLAPGDPALLPAAGQYDKARLARLFSRMWERLTDGLHMDVTGTIAQGDQVAVEVESSGDLRNGRRYRQRYHFFLQFRGEKIATVREYLDTLHVHDVWYRA
jgi:uncharacterized protein